MKPHLMLLALFVCHTESRSVFSADAAETYSTLSGTITDPDGKPLEDVRVDISTAAPKIGRGIFCPSCYLDCSKWDSTDSHGGFRLAKLDPTLKFRLLIALPGRKIFQTKLIDPLDGPVDVTLQQLPDDIDAARVVSGIVKNDQGIPVAGALVEPHGAKTSSRRWWGRVKGVDPTVTDARGRFSMLLPDEFQALDIEVTGHGFSGIQVALLEPGSEPAEVIVQEGARVIGRLVRRGQPVAGMSIAVVQTDRGSSNGIFIAAVGDVTDAKGAFEFRNLPPEQQYCIYSVAGDAKRTQSDHILTVRTFEVPESGATRDLDSLEVAEPISIRGRVERVDGQPLPRNLKLSFGREPAWDLVGIHVADDGSFEAEGLPPETYEIRLGNRSLVMVSSRIKYQMLSDVSFGIHVQESIENLIIPVKGK